MEREDVASKLKYLIEEQSELVISNNDDQLDIDSYMMMLIITYVDEEMGVRLDMDQLDFDDFKSLNTFTDLVLKTNGS
jgi:acyl carrier protein